MAIAELLSSSPFYILLPTNAIVNCKVLNSFSSSSLFLRVNNNGVAGAASCFTSNGPSSSSASSLFLLVNGNGFLLVMNLLLFLACCYQCPMV